VGGALGTARGDAAARASEVAMKDYRSAKVRKILALRTRAAKLAADYEPAQSAAAPARHRARQLLEEVRVLKGTLTACELAELRRAWSGV
jgi:hypothetical protein